MILLKTLYIIYENKLKVWIKVGLHAAYGKGCICVTMLKTNRNDKVIWSESINFNLIWIKD
jgi:hypothetical protein